MSTTEIYVYDDFLSENDFKTIKTIVSSQESFPWFYHRNIANTHDMNSDRQFGFSHVLYDKNSNGINSIYTEYFFPILKNIEEKTNTYIESLLRIRVGMLLKVSDSSFENDKHLDYQSDHLVFLLYLNTTDGNTSFYNNENIKIESVAPLENRGVLFNGRIIHSASTPTITQERVVVNIDFVPKEKSVKFY